MISIIPRSQAKHCIAAGLICISFALVKLRAQPFYYISSLGTEARREGQFERSCQWRHLALNYVHVVGLGPWYIADIAFNLAYVYHNKGDLKHAEEYCQLALQSENSLRSHLETTELLAEVYDEQGKAQKSELLYEEIVRHGARVAEECGRDFDSDLNNLAGVCIRNGNYDRAREILQRLFERDLVSKFDTSHSLHRDLSRLAFVDDKQNFKVSTAASLWNVTRHKLRMTPQEIDVAKSFADAYHFLKIKKNKNNLDEAYKPLWALFDGATPDAHTLEFLRQQAYILNDEGRLSEAEYVLRRQYKMLLASPSVGLYQRSDSLFNLATCLRRQGRMAESAPIQAEGEVLYRSALKKTTSSY
ncbi:MAG: tetratricopeptide repeat protein [Candidatus Obscuribacterales bacterium]